jgi:hypothetical protein
MQNNSFHAISIMNFIEPTVGFWMNFAHFLGQINFRGFTKNDGFRTFDAQCCVIIIFSSTQKSIIASSNVSIRTPLGFELAHGLMGE